MNAGGYDRKYACAANRLCKFGTITVVRLVQTAEGSISSLSLDEFLRLLPFHNLHMIPKKHKHLRLMGRMVRLLECHDGGVGLPHRLSAILQHKDRVVVNPLCLRRIGPSRNLPGSTSPGSIKNVNASPGSKKIFDVGSVSFPIATASSPRDSGSVPAFF